MPAPDRHEEEATRDSLRTMRHVLPCRHDRLCDPGRPRPVEEPGQAGHPAHHRDQERGMDGRPLRVGRQWSVSPRMSVSQDSGADVRMFDLRNTTRGLPRLCAGLVGDLPPVAGHQEAGIRADRNQRPRKKSAVNGLLRCIGMIVPWLPQRGHKHVRRRGFGRVCLFPVGGASAPRFSALKGLLQP